MFHQYRQVFRPPGSVAFTLAGLAARLPMGMGSISATVMITASGRSYTIAGSCGAAVLITVAFVGPFQARLVDRHGQARIAVPATVLATLGAAALLLCLHWNAPTWTIIAASVVSGLGPNIGSLARARWAALHLADEPALHSAYALESVVDEICFILGPVAAMALCTAIFPSAGYLIGAVIAFVATLAFTAQRSTEPEPRPQVEGESVGPAWRAEGMPLMIVTFAAVGGVFGSVEISTIGFATHLGERPAASFVLAAYALGSGISGFLFGLWRPRGTTRQRFRCCLAAMALSLAPLTVVHSLPLIAAVLLVAGFTTAPTVVTGTALIRESVSEHAVTEGLTWGITGILLGVSAGSALGGWAVDHLAPGMGYRVPTLTAALALLISLVRSGAGPVSTG